MYKNLTGYIPYGKQVDFTGNLIHELSVKVESLEHKINNETPKEKMYLTRREVAILCCIKSMVTLWNWKQSGILVPKARAGRKPLYLRQDVIDYLNGVNKIINN